MRSALRCLATRYVAGLAPYKALVFAVFVAVFLQGAAAQAAALRLVAIGDSLTHGYGLPPDQGFVPQLQAWLEQQGRDVQVVNMGVSGDTTQGGKARLDWALADGADAVIVALGGNDLLRGIDPALSRANLDDMLRRLGERGIPVLLSGLDAPLNYGAAFKEAFDGMYVDLAKAHNAVLYQNFLAGIEGGTQMQPDGIHPSAEGVAVMINGIGPKVLELLDRVAVTQ